MRAQSRYQPVCLLALLLVGWVAAPLVHQLDHASRWASDEHAHERTSLDGTWETGCHEEERSIEDCPACLTRVASELEASCVPHAEERLAETVPSARAHIDSRYLWTNGARGPPFWM